MEFIYEVTEDMPFDIHYPKGYEEWIRKTLPACIFYDRFKKVMHCTRCGYTGEYDYKIRKGDRVICPECGEELTAFSHTTPQLGCDATFLHFWKTKSAIYYAEVWAAWNYNYAKANDELLKACVKNYSPTREMDETTRIVPLSIGKITRKEQRAWQRWWSYRHGRSCAVMEHSHIRLRSSDAMRHSFISGKRNQPSTTPKCGPHGIITMQKQTTNCSRHASRTTARRGKWTRRRA